MAIKPVPVADMTLWDYFAGQALAGNCGMGFELEDDIPASSLAAKAASIASAMLGERRQRETWRATHVEAAVRSTRTEADGEDDRRAIREESGL